MAERTKQAGDFPGPKRGEEFSRHTVTLPKHLIAFVEEQRNSPRHAGNLSSFLRSLIAAEKARTNKRKALAPVLAPQ